MVLAKSCTFAINEAWLVRGEKSISYCFFVALNVVVIVHATYASRNGGNHVDRFTREQSVNREKSFSA